MQQALGRNRALQQPRPGPWYGERKPEESLLHSIRRSQSADTRLELGPSRAVRFEEPSSPDTGHQRLSSSEYEQPSEPKGGTPKTWSTSIGKASPFLWIQG